MVLFGKKDKEHGHGSFSAIPAATSEVTTRAPEPVGSSRTDSSQTIVGPALRIKGELSAEEDVTVEGRVEGILSSTKALHVTDSGVVEADVRAETVLVRGRILGNVIAAEKVEIFPSGQLEGNIRSPKISIHEGAQFKGNVDMSAASESGADDDEVEVEPPTPTPES